MPGRQDPQSAEDRQRANLHGNADRDDEDSHLGDFIEDTTLELPLDSATTESLRAATHDVLAGLTAREAKVLRMRFGIDMNTDHTLEEVGNSSTLPANVSVRSKRRRCANCVTRAVLKCCVASWTINR
ncbi:sigma factor-like helix-turn-helix DNA-binding protein [Shigella flexneri]|uniref:sigma factor-like helix-turn-helix DNA-binding protein n=1 Tax=Shigella flexneri TaxID=623 RepID=UPI002540C7EB|nr:sigma factor-like helix-turn-helix DNA-binding protein [Shigella flexneri]